MVGGVMVEAFFSHQMVLQVHVPLARPLATGRLLMSVARGGRMEAVSGGPVRVVKGRAAEGRVGFWGGGGGEGGAEGVVEEGEGEGKVEQQRRQSLLGL